MLPLAFGLVPDDMSASAFSTIWWTRLKTRRHGHIGTGLIGGQYLMRVLSDNGRPDLAYTIATQKDLSELGLHG